MIRIVWAPPVPPVVGPVAACSAPNIRNDGFNAEWVASEYNRPYPSTWRAGELNVNHYSNHFGVQLLQRADYYQKNMRSAKYALLIIALSFAVFFFFELWLKTGIHPIQYIMIGFSLIVFYTLLLSLTEHIGFNRAYWISFVVVLLLLLQVYTYGILSNWRPVLALSGLFVALYGYIFVLMQLEDFALLAGSIGLFVILATVMLLSRKVDWYRLGT
jgi:inner membrane protein